jgi:hypothetical protein
MRTHQRLASATLAGLVFIVIAACGGSAQTAGSPSPVPSPSPSCVNPKAAHRAYVVVQHLDSRVVQGCVGFDGSDINGDELMKQSGIQFKTQSFSFGIAYCQIDSEPDKYDSCFSQTGPNWSLYVSQAGAAYKSPQTGAGGIKLADKDALGWRYQTGQGSPPPLPKT